jgi:hypothetical protein
MAYLPSWLQWSSASKSVQLEVTAKLRRKAMKKYMIEREIPKVGTLNAEQLSGAAAKSNEALSQLGSDVQWVESYVTDDKTFCVYLAKDEEIIRRRAELSGFPATKIMEIGKMIDPTTANKA